MLLKNSYEKNECMLTDIILLSTIQKLALVTDSYGSPGPIVYVILFLILIHSS